LKRLYPLSHVNDFVFNPSPRDFIVEEIPLYDFAGEGEHAMALVRKKELTTWEMVKILSEHLGIKQREIGYAGLKDKHAMTMQYVSFPARLEPRLSHFAHEQIKILSTTRHTNKIRIGHLKGNRFSLRFKKVLGIQQTKIDSVLDWIEANGVPNYFGDQRFGVDGNNWELGKAIVEGRYRERNRRTREFLISAYQSYLFNGWLSRRIEMSRLLESFSETETEQVLGLARGTLAGTKSQLHFFKLLSGDVMMHYPFGRIFHAEDVADEAIKFHARDRSPTGLIPGKRAQRALGSAREFESEYDVAIGEDGSRRYAWIFPDEILRKYLPEKAHFELSFTLPKGAYATNVVDLLRGGKVS
jgi:tRNA pseudouridine13 synthase